MNDDIRNLFSYRLALLARANERDAQGILVSQHGMTLGEWRTLSVIRVLNPCTPRRLAAEDFLDEGQMSRTVKLLVDRGWVRKQPAPADGRSTHLSLTEAGERVYRDLISGVEEANERMLACLEPDERTQLMDALLKILDDLREKFRS